MQRIHPPNVFETQRNRVMALLCVSVLMLSGSIEEASRVGIRSATLLPQRSAVVDTTDPLEISLARANPSLGSEERDRILAAIDRYSDEYGLDSDLVMAVMLVESGARPWAHSPKGAVGLMQVMPHMMRPPSKYHLPWAYGTVQCRGGSLLAI